MVSFYHALHRVTLPPSYMAMAELFNDLMNQSVYCEAKLTHRTVCCLNQGFSPLRN